MFQILVVEITGSQRHHQVTQTNQRGVSIRKQADNHVVTENRGGGFLSVLQTTEKQRTLKNATNDLNDSFTLC